MSIHRRMAKSGVRWDVKLRDPDGRMYQRSFRRKADAEAWEREQLHSQSRGGWVDPRRLNTTFEAVATDWLTANPSKRPSALARDETIVRVHLLPAFGSRAVGSITPGDVQKLVNALMSEAKAPRTVRRVYGTLRAIFNHAVNGDLLVRSPCRGIKLPRVEQETRPVVSAEQLAALAEAVTPAYSPMVYLGAVVGLRWGECAGLRVGRIDFLRGTLTVAEQLTRGPHGVPVAGPPKSSAGRRTLLVPAALMDMLATHLAARGLTGADSAELLFVAPDGGPLVYENWRRRVWLPACEATGLDGLTFHDLRRANATAMVLDGIDVKTAQVRLGHSDPRLTLAIYAQATREGQRRAADRLGKRFMPEPMWDDSGMPEGETRVRRPPKGA